MEDLVHDWSDLLPWPCQSHTKVAYLPAVIDEFELYSCNIPLYHIIQWIYNIFQHDYNMYNYKALFDHILIVHQEINWYICRVVGDITVQLFFLYVIVAVLAHRTHAIDQW